MKIEARLTYDSATDMNTFGSRDTRHVAWMVNSLGYGDDLLYWGPILSRYVRAFPNTRFFAAADGRKPIPGSAHAVERMPSLRIPLGKRTNSYDRHVRLLSPTSLRRLRRWRPRLVVISEFTLPSLYVATFRRVLGMPRVLLLVESDPLRGNPHRINRVNRIIRRLIAKRVDCVLTNNAAGQQYLLERLKIPGHRVLCHPYVVSEAPSCKTRLSKPQLRSELGLSDELTFLYTGQLIERKGVMQLLEAVARLTMRERSQCRFQLIGDGKQRISIERKITQLGLDAVVCCLGPKPYESLCRYYQSADVFVMPTLDDYRALVGFEAISYGLPLLHSCYDGAVSEVVVEGENGFVFDPLATTRFAGQIRWFLNHRSRLDAFSRCSLEISRKFNVDAAASNLVNATQHCLDMR